MYKVPPQAPVNSGVLVHFLKNIESPDHVTVIESLTTKCMLYRIHDHPNQI